MRITAVTCIKNEGPFLLEWIAYHRLIGVTDFLFYTNDCTDGSDALLDALGAFGVVRRDNPSSGPAFQMDALRVASRDRLLRAADWVWVADIDEFPQIAVGDGRFSDLIAACDGAQAISLCFRYFANAGVEVFVDLPVIQQFTQTHNPDIWTSDRASEVKTLTRADFPLGRLGAHRPFLRPDADAAQIRWTDGSGRQVPNKFLNADKPATTRKLLSGWARGLASLNHYALRSLDSFLVKVARGDVNRPDRLFDLRYWQERNDCAVQDSAILRHLPALRAQMALMMQDPEVATRHQTCVDRHRDMIAELKAQPDYAALRRALAKAPALPPDEITLLAELGISA
ncbi:MAG: glycosyltransferase family 2 protein [Pelagimonas sp.]|nr:glycosyltransferase family 2 protein [Pelagimonas sp.]